MPRLNVQNQAVKYKVNLDISHSISSVVGSTAGT